jgi:nucleotidyltransferase/DNA polymerase involved in DNA repair
VIAALCFDPLPLFLAVRADPQLARTPLVSVEEQRVTHANAAAKRHGITPGMRLDGARMRVEGLQVVSYPEPDLQHAWEELLRELSGHTPWVESRSRGRALARLEPDEAEALAVAYGVRVGLAPDCETAELAALSTRPGTARRVDDVQGFLARLPLRFLRGVGLSDGNLTRLTWLGLATVGHLAAWTQTQVTSYLGEEGDALLPYVHGPRRSTLRPFEQAPTVSRSLAFTEPVVEPAQILPAIERLAHDLAKELSGRAARRLTLTASLPGGTRRASRLSKRPLTQARHIRQQVLFALHDSQAQGHPIERITVELAAPEPLGVQEGLWPRRERRQRALEATLERFPTAPRRLEWEDPNAQATDRVGRWEGYASEGGAYDTASVAERRAPGVAGKRRRAARDERPAVPAAALAASVPLFEDQPYQPTPTVADVAGEPTHAVTTPGTVAAAVYLDALFTGAFTPEEGTAASEGGLAVPVPSSGRPHAAAQTEQRRLFLARRPQRYTEDYALEDDYGLEAA